MKIKTKLLAVGMILTAASYSFGQTGSMVQFSYSGYYGAFENSGLATVTVTRYIGTNAFSVDYATSDGSAVAGVDYTAQSGTLSFGEGEMEKTFTVSVLDDNLTEGVETVRLTLKNPMGQVTLGQPSEANLWIVDDEPGATLLDPSFAPRLSIISTYDGKEYAGGGVTAIAVQADGKILIGGNFDKVNGVNRGHIARLNADGSLDMSFDAGSGPENTSACQYGFVSALAVTDGAIYVGGRFTSFSGVSLTGIAKLNPDGALDGSFKQTLAGEPNDGCGVLVNSIVMQADGKTFIGGYFVALNGGLGVARLNSDGTLDTTFSSALDPSALVNTLALQKDGKVLVGGYNISLVRLNANGSVDGSFNPNFAGQYARVNSIVVQEDGKLIVGGYFGLVNGISRNGIVRLNSDGSVDTSFDPGTGATDEFGVHGEVRSVTVQSDGKILLVGNFRYVNGLRRDGIARLHPDGSVDTSFHPGASTDFDFVSYYGGGPIVLQSDGKVLLAGRANWNGIESRDIIRLNSGLTIRSQAFTSANYVAGENSGTASVTVERIGDTSGTITVDYSTSPGTASAGSDYVERSGTLSFAPREALKTIAIPLLDDGLVENDKTVNLTLGNPTGGALLGPQRMAVLRILDNERPGSLDPGFNPPLGIRPGISSLVVQPDGKVWVSGDYYYTTFLGRLNPDGSLDSSFIPGYRWQFIGLQSGSRAIIFGYSETLGSYALQRVKADGLIDTGYVETECQGCYFFPGVVQPDDKVIVLVYDYPLYSIRRFNADGGVDDSFTHVQVDGYGRAMTLQLDGKVLISGGFSMVNGVSHQGVARLLPNGDLDSSFNPSLATNAIINSLVVQPDGKVIIGGNFSTQGGLPRNNLVRLNADGSLDSSFAPADVATNAVTALALQTDGKLIVAGSLASADGSYRYPLSRLNTDGSIDENFDGTGPNGGVNRMAWQSDGKLLIAGGFTEVDGVRRLTIARLNGDPPFKFGPLTRTAGGPLRLSLTAPPGKNYVLQASTNLMDWLALSTNTPAGFNLEFEDTDAANFPRRFYRARQLAP